MDNLNIRKKIPVVLIVIGLTISIVSLIMLAINAFTVRITIPYECCDFMFGCSTEEFFDRDLELYKEIGDLRSFARLGDNKELELILTKKQAATWSNILESKIREIDNAHENIEVSDDYSKIIAYCYAETEEASMLIIEDLVILISVVRVVDEADILYQFILRDAGTHQDVWRYTAYLDGNYDSEDVGNEDLTSMPKENK